MTIVADRLWRKPLPQPRWMGGFQTAAGLVTILMMAGAGAFSGDLRGAGPAVLAAALGNLAGGTSTLPLKRSPAFAGVLRVVSLTVAVGILLFFVGGLVGDR